METSPLDTVAHYCMELTEALKGTTDDAERDSILFNHIKKLYHSQAPIEDFKKHLEWVNVTEPLRLNHHCASMITILDFWTYCCINCYHVLPDLADVERIYGSKSGVCVIGIHCAKFTNEKDLPNIFSAVQRYGITHPVVNDPDSVMWQALGIKCWPTLVILGPSNKPLFILVGEGHREELLMYVKAAKNYFGTDLSTISLPIKNRSVVAAEEVNSLRFPGKVAVNPFYDGTTEGAYIAVSDTGNNRILVANCTGNVIKIIGGIEPGLLDGDISAAKFNSPQGLCWLTTNVIAVCDTGNHCIRTLHLDEETVDILAGTGSKAPFGDLGGECLGLQALNSPWDVVLYHTPDMDMSVRLPAPRVTDEAEPETDSPLSPPPPPPLPGAASDNAGTDNSGTRRVLLIACAGSHQIWAVYLDTTIWWKYKKYNEGICVCIAGSGAEAARNSTYPATASFAQPSGITLKSGRNEELIIADAESSSIRRIVLSSGQVSTIAGGDKNPLNLFAYGDVDDDGVEAKFQHPLGVAYCERTKTVFVADTYNNKLKRINQQNKVVTVIPKMLETNLPAKFNEPSGLSLDTEGKYLYIADTNNHCIKQLNVSKNICQDFRLIYPQPKFVEPDNLILYRSDLYVNKNGGTLVIYFDVSLQYAESKSVKFTPGAPQQWTVCVREENGKEVTRELFEFVGSSSKGTELPARVQLKINEKAQEKSTYRLYLGLQTALCDNNVCFSHAFTVRSTILLRESVKMMESYRITCRINPLNSKST